MADADKRLDELAATGRLNPALLLLMAKAHAAAKESSYTKEEAKDVMAHLYFKVCLHCTVVCTMDGKLSEHTNTLPTQRSSMVMSPAPSWQLDGRRGLEI